MKGNVKRINIFLIFTLFVLSSFTRKTSTVVGEYSKRSTGEDLLTYNPPPNSSCFRAILQYHPYNIDSILKIRPLVILHGYLENYSGTKSLQLVYKWGYKLATSNPNFEDSSGNIRFKLKSGEEVNLISFIQANKTIEGWNLGTNGSKYLITESQLKKMKSEEIDSIRISIDDEKKYQENYHNIGVDNKRFFINQIKNIE